MTLTKLLNRLLRFVGTTRLMSVNANFNLGENSAKFHFCGDEKLDGFASLKNTIFLLDIAYCINVTMQTMEVLVKEKNSCTLICN